MNAMPIKFCIYSDLVLTNKGRKNVADKAMVRMDVRIVDIISKGDIYYVKICFPLTKDVSSFELIGFVKEYIATPTMYITNITHNAFKQCFKYKTREDYQKDKATETSTSSETVNVPKELQKDFVKLDECRKALYCLMAKHTNKGNNSKGVTVEQLAFMCLQEVIRGNGQKEVLLSDSDECNELHTCWTGLSLLNPSDYEPYMIHDNNDLTKCMLLS